MAAEYRRRGYTLRIDPDPSQLPDFLAAFGPDLIAEGPYDSVVVELKERGRARPAGYWAQLAEALQQQPGWRLDIVTGGGQTTEPPTSLGPRDIEAKLREGQRLAAGGAPDAALLIIWSGAEAALRLVAERHEVELPDFRPATVITRVYSDGLMDREDYDVLMRQMQARNELAHGFRGATVDPDALDRLRAIVRSLLREAKAEQRDSPGSARGRKA